MNSGLRGLREAELGGGDDAAGGGGDGGALASVVDGAGEGDDAVLDEFGIVPLVEGHFGGELAQLGRPDDFAALEAEGEGLDHLLLTASSGEPGLDGDGKVFDDGVADAVGLDDMAAGPGAGTAFDGGLDDRVGGGLEALELGDPPGGGGDVEGDADRGVLTAANIPKGDVGVARFRVADGVGIGGGGGAGDIGGPEDGLAGFDEVAGVFLGPLLGGEFGPFGPIPGSGFAGGAGGGLGEVPAGRVVGGAAIPGDDVAAELATPVAGPEQVEGIGAAVGGAEDGEAAAVGDGGGDGLVDVLGPGHPGEFVEVDGGGGVGAAGAAGGGDAEDAGAIGEGEVGLLVFDDFGNGEAGGGEGGLDVAQDIGGGLEVAGDDEDGGAGAVQDGVEGLEGDELGDADLTGFEDAAGGGAVGEEGGLVAVGLLEAEVAPGRVEDARPGGEEPEEGVGGQFGGREAQADVRAGEHRGRPGREVPPGRAPGRGRGS